MRKCCLGIMALLLVWCFPMAALPAALLTPQDVLIKDRDTGAVFPASVSLVYDGTPYQLAITGLAVRTKFFLNVYCLAHYMDDPPAGTTGAVLSAIMSDSHAKQVTMHFVRDVSAERIQRALLKGFRRNATEAELEAIQPLVERFAHAIHRDVKENDRFIIRWLPGGRTSSVFEGREVTNITNIVFAKVLWSIWFGEHSVVNRDQLVRFLVAES